MSVEVREGEATSERRSGREEANLGESIAPSSHHHPEPFQKNDEPTHQCKSHQIPLTVCPQQQLIVVASLDRAVARQLSFQDLRDMISSSYYVCYYLLN